MVIIDGHSDFTREPPVSGERCHKEEASPGKTIVGGRPPEQTQILKGVPTGIQKLILAAAVDERFRHEFLKERSAAAREIQVTLTDSEKAILSAVPEQQLQLMIDQMKESPRMPRRTFLAQTAAALGVFVATAFSACAQEPGQVITRGIDPDHPPMTRGISYEAPPLKWCAPLERALSEAGQKSQVVMAVFLEDHEPAQPHAPGSPEAISGELCTFHDTDMRRLIYKWNLLPTQVKDSRLAKKYRINRFPAILLLSPSGKEVGRILQPLTADDVAKAIMTAMDSYHGESR